MTHFVIVPDSFKGSLSAIEVCDIAREVIENALPDAQVTTLPVADGGEGSVDAFLGSVGGERMTLEVTGPYGEPIEAAWALLPGGRAVVEMAQAAGLPQVGDDRRAHQTTTYGVGELIAAALDHDITELVIGLGGSATNEGGAGAAAALGVRFLDAAGNVFVPVGETLADIAAIDASGIDPRLTGVTVIAMCDIDNPLLGETGASAVFGPQKGASPKQVAMLDAGLAHFAQVISRDLGKDVADAPGAGAAGGMGAGMLGFLDAELKPGIDTVLDVVGFDEILKSADVVITGEGSFDEQSLRGKVVVGVARRAKAQGVEVHALAGRVVELAIEPGREIGVTHVHCINPPGEPLEVSIANAATNLADTVRRIVTA